MLKKINPRIKNLLSYKAELKKSKVELDYFLHHDQLTGLPNRNTLMNDLTLWMENNKDQAAIIVLADIDHFKLINDSMGHKFGDELLKEAAQSFRDPIMIGKAYRLGGDEFAAIIPLADHDTNIGPIILEIQNQFKKPLLVGSSQIHVNLSIGVAIYPKDGETLHDVLKCADIALNEAKKAGRNRYLAYQTSMDHGFKERTLIEQHLHKALSNNEFELYYQPQLVVETGEVSGLEALIRWKSPDLGFIPPDRFIGIAEETQLIIPIGEWVLKRACRFIKTINDEGFENLSISVNVSIVQLLQESFVKTVLDTLDEIGLEPSLLELEITESILVESYETIGQKLAKLKAHGIKIAMDDFGRGYSSLSGLKQLPIHTLKIDKLFMDSILEQPEEQTITDLIISIGQKMGLTVLAEGVETKAQVDYLVRHHCLMAQGYYFSRPLPEYETIKFIRNYVDQKAV